MIGLRIAVVDVNLRAINIDQAWGCDLFSKQQELGFQGTQLDR